jgi:hypothetical protein
MARVDDLAESPAGVFRSATQEENMLISKSLLLMASALALTTPALAQERATAFEYSAVARLTPSGQFQAEVWRRDVRTGHSDLAWSNRELYLTPTAAMVEACTSLRKNFDVASSCSDQQPVVLARDDSVDRTEVHDPDGTPVGRHGPQKVPQRILDAQRRWIELEAVPTHGQEAPARATPQRPVASRAAPQRRARDRAPANPSATTVATKTAVPAGKRKLVVYEEFMWDPSGAWLEDFWKKQEMHSGGGGSEGGGSGGGGGGY